MSVWHCPQCNATVTWIFDVSPGCPYCRATNQGGTMQRVTDERRQPTRAAEFRRVLIEEDAPRPLFFDEHDLAVIGMYEDDEDDAP